MPQHKYAVIVFALCAGLTACENAPSRDLTAPEAGTLDALSASPLAASNTWTSEHPMSLRRGYVVAGTINKIVYVLGGLAPSTDPNNPSFVTSTTVQAYNVVTNTWSLKKSVPTAGQLNGASPINGRLYVTDVSNNGVALYVYTPGTNTWTIKAHSPAIGSCHGGSQGAIGGLLYVHPGCRLFFRYNPATNTWVTLKGPPTGHIFSPAAGVIGGKFYLASGAIPTNFHTIGTLDVYDPATNTWTTKASIPQPRSNIASAVINGQLFAAGGENSGGATVATLQVYNAATNTWTTKAPLPGLRRAAAGAAANGLFFVSGGRDKNDNLLTTVQAYTP